ncbi:hypothetical protein V6Z12_D04G018400 [Gossypium hirsutum]
MNVLLGLLNIASEHKVFQYHPRCQDLQVTHGCFVDDLLVFTKGTTEPIVAISNILDFFYCISGTQMNNVKSELYCSGIDPSEQLQIVECIGITTEALPFRYLGVPLVANNLSVTDCKGLVERISHRINCWMTKVLHLLVDFSRYSRSSLVSKIPGSGFCFFLLRL